MSTLEQRLVALAQNIGADVKVLTNAIGALAGLSTTAKSSLVNALNEVWATADASKSAIGEITGLSTTAKTNLVAAINEVRAAVSAVDLTALIKDDAVAGTTNKVFSADKTLGLLSALETKILGGITPEALDTIKELADFLTNETVANGLLAQMANRVRADAVQNFDAGKQAQARSNIGAAAAADLTALSNAVGNTDHDFVADYNTAKA